MTNAEQRADIIITNDTDRESFRSESMKTDAVAGAFYWRTDECEIMIFPESSRAAVVYNGDPVYGDWDDGDETILLDTLNSENERIILDACGHDVKWWLTHGVHTCTNCGTEFDCNGTPFCSLICWAKDYVSQPRIKAMIDGAPE